MDIKEAKATARAPGVAAMAPFSMAGAGLGAMWCSCALTWMSASTSSSREAFTEQLTNAIQREREIGLCEESSKQIRRRRASFMGLGLEET